MLCVFVKKTGKNVIDVCRLLQAFDGASPQFKCQSISYASARFYLPFKKMKNVHNSSSISMILIYMSYLF